MDYTLEQAIERAFDRCNLEGEDSDIYNQMYKYKAIRDKMAEANTEVVIVQMTEDGRYIGDWYLYR